MVSAVEIMFNIFSSLPVGIYAQNTVKGDNVDYPLETLLHFGLRFIETPITPRYDLS